MPVWVALLIALVAFYTMAAVIDGPFIKSLDVLARWMKLPSSVAGATLLAFGTSAPEISTALVALFAEGTHPATGVGSIVGSAIFQILAVVGFAALIKKSTLDWRPVLRDSLFYALSIVLLILFIHDDRFTAVEAGLLVGTYAIYLGVMWIWARNVEEDEPAYEEAPAREEERARSPVRRVMSFITWPIDALVALCPDPEAAESWTIPVFLGSLALIGYVCYWLVFAAEALALAFGVPPAIVALTILAGGSSIPELISSAAVSRQGRGDMAIANAIGSNIFDVLISLGLPVLIYCLIYGDVTGLGGANVISSIVLLFGTLLMVIALLAAQRFRIGRIFGAFLIMVYAVYVVAAYLGWIG